MTLKINRICQGYHAAHIAIVTKMNSFDGYTTLLNKHTEPWMEECDICGEIHWGALNYYFQLPNMSFV